MDEQLPGVTRRQYLNRSIVAFVVMATSGAGAAVTAFVWPRRSVGTFGARVDAGSVEGVLSTIRSTREPVYVSEGRFYLVPVDGGDGVLALYQKCPHLGCRVPFCATSQWFECGCHQSKYNRVGEWKAGPAPRGMDRFPTVVEDGRVLVDTGAIEMGPPVGTNTSGQEAEGPHCVAGAAEDEEGPS